jgi:flagellin-like hook-associated protein FlgL
MARITFTTLYDTTMRNLQRNSSEMNKIDNQIVSGRKINRPSDNPVGFANAMAYTNSLNSLGQKQVNIADAQGYMDSLERTTNSMVNLYANSRDLAVQASNDPMNHAQRLITNLDIRGNLEQLVALSQTRHKDNYIFSGKWTNVPPYEIKKGIVNFSTTMYNGIPNPNMAGYDYNTAVFPPTLNSVTPLATPNATYAGSPIDAVANPDPSTWTMFDNPDEVVRIPLFDNAYLDMNFTPGRYAEAQRIIPGSLELINDYGLVEKPEKNKEFPGLDEITATMHPDYNKADYEVDYENGYLILISDKAKAAFLDTTNGGLKSTTPPAGQNPPPSISFDYVYCSTKDMSGEIYREIDPGVTIKINSNPETMFGKDGRGQTDAFKELIHLMQGLWYNDQSQIAEGIDTIDVAHRRALAEQTVIGGKQTRMIEVLDRNKHITENETEIRSNIRDVDLEEALTKFSMADTVYNASLYSASIMMRNTLMDYL